MFSSNDIHSSNSESIACLQASIAGSKPSGFDRHACLGTLNRHRLAPQSIRTIILTKNKSKVTVGSDPGIADVAVQMTGVSRKHFTIEEEDGGVMLKDHSTNGTFVNHTRIHHSQVMLLDGTQISLEEGIVHRTSSFKLCTHSLLVKYCRLDVCWTQCCEFV
ncbi:hypothetical protein BCR33DRAFT_721217 [Rhizoclosmatium globosum]|uniref:FHA domain-containing protein n=1 Tax=Rhizoclosmatium globosum TaxID=329046 RepID=A0A1Y2BSN6_9FUNG|nr:hypothetical protein BCR33DRAFT_721217 [Rhizoclosmatium globosum]|eukprot:ORY37761.1 hypothetical protein BCR33DRAFT_721217 [Rhizoclosmatium globosum]